MHAKVMGFMFQSMSLSGLTTSAHTVIGMLTAKTGPDTATQGGTDLPHIFSAGLNKDYLAQHKLCPLSQQPPCPAMTFSRRRC